LEEHRVAQQPTDRTEIRSLLAMAAREMADAHAKDLSTDARFAHAYSVARSLALAVVRAHGYRIKNQGGGHYNTFQALRATDAEFAGKAQFFDQCREKRNTILYDSVDGVTATETEQLFVKVAAFEQAVIDWLRQHHSELL